MKRAVLMLLAATLAAGSALAEEPTLKPTVDLRLRGEDFDTPSAAASRDQTYTLGHARLRLGLDVAWTRVTLSGVLQAAGTTGLPENGAFAAGPLYFGANDGDTSPSHVGIAELNATFKGDAFKATVGRQRFTDGFEVGTGIPYLDGIKRRRLSERLVGNWDWVNVGRRFDGVSFGLEGEEAHLAGFALRPLAGGVDYDDAFEELDDLAVYGLTVTGRYGAWLPKGEVRLFAIQYDDGRPGAVRAAGGDIEITTLGASFLAGDDNDDLLAWVALQQGDWGLADQEAWAAILEAGHQWTAAPGKPTVRIGAAQASGTALGGDEHEGFFNLLPTNHKFYGSMDYSAFSNLRNLYLEALFAPAPKLTARLGLEHFELVEREDAWYGGSGAYDETSLGYAARRPAGGVFDSRDIGREVDLDMTWQMRKDLALDFGGGLFFGGDAAEEALPAEQDGTWAYLQLRWQR